MLWITHPPLSILYTEEKTAVADLCSPGEGEKRLFHTENTTDKITGMYPWYEYVPLLGICTPGMNMYLY